MSKSTTMLRTRRKDNNVKPNRRLDRKSSRGMLYENEELRLKTININAEVERGQSDIKKLKRENDQLRREIWYLRDEYDKLDKLLREKESQGSSSSSSCTSESESCSSCTEESEAVETSQNIENVQKTNLKKLTQEFDHLSVVPEENSAENSEKNSNSNRASLPENCTLVTEKDVIKPDQSYPTYDNLTKTTSTLPVQEKTPKHFFSPIKMAKANEDYVNNQFLGPETPYMGQTYAQPSRCYDNLVQPTPTDTRSFVPHSNFYPGLPLPGLHKTTTDVIVKTDNQNFNTLRSRSSFSNGGNLEELLNDIETISHDILKISNSQSSGFQSPNLQQQSICPPFVNFNGENFNENTSDIVSQIQNTNLSDLPSPRIDNYEITDENNRIQADRPYRSELNVVLMPSPMQLIEVDKYKNIEKSCESLNKRSIENLSASCQSLKIIPEIAGSNVIISPESFYEANGQTPQSTPNLLDPFQPFVPVPPLCPTPDERIFPESLQQQNLLNEQTTNPFFFGNIRQPPTETSEYFNARYIPENFASKDADTSWKTDASKMYKTSQRKDPELYSSKTNLLDTAVSSDHISSENEENLKFKTSRNDKESKPTEKSSEREKDSKKNDTSKSPKLNIRRKVSIHFKGKKDKSKSKDSKNLEPPKQEEKPKTPIQDKKHSFFDFGFSSDAKDKKGLHQKTPSIESKISNAHLEPKITTSGDSKTSTSENKNSKTDSKNLESSSLSDQKNATSDLKALDRKSRKSSSASPERKHGHKEGKKGHKKHKKGERTRHRRTSISADRFHRERSYSVCTDRSNILDNRLGLYSVYDDFITTSERERTNSLSSCDTIKGRKLSNISHFPNTGKIPWCGCWGNGCL